MSRPRQKLRRSTRVALFAALGGGLTQGAGVVAGYVPGLAARFFAVAGLVGFATLVVLVPEVLDHKKNLGLAQ